MPIIFVLVVSVFWCGVQASQLDSATEEATAPARTEEVRSLITLKQQRHSLRTRLFSRVRTPSIAPPSGERRRKLQEDLSQIESMIQKLHMVT